jgi:hypothetical protein
VSGSAGAELTVVSLKPAEDGTVEAQIDFAGGAYIMAGTATRKKDTSR